MITRPILYTRIHHFELEGEQAVEEPFTGGERGHAVEDCEEVCELC
jgi:hypothetical protein